MNYSFEYIDIILLAMIAGFIFLRLRGILGKKSGFEDKMSASFAHDFPAEKSKKTLNEKTFDEKAKKDFLSGAKIAYETIITSFSSGNLKNVKPLLDKKVYDQFDSEYYRFILDGELLYGLFEISANSCRLSKNY